MDLAVNSPLRAHRHSRRPGMYYHVRRQVAFHEFDRDYVLRLTKGDPSTEQHFAAYFDHLLLLKLRSRVRSQQLVEDIRQETYLRVFRKLRNDGGIDHPERLGAFVNAVCQNVLLEMLRSDQRHPLIADDALEPVDRTIDLEGALVMADRKKLVTTVLKQLPGKDRMILRMVFLEEADKDNVCKKMGVDRNYLRVLLHRARNRFKAILMKDGEPAGPSSEKNID
jgi:RNA polymerase sigma-70 factor (ECF subfamily)